MSDKETYYHSAIRTFVPAKVTKYHIFKDTFNNLSSVNLVVKTSCSFFSLMHIKTPFSHCKTMFFLYPI